MVEGIDSRIGKTPAQQIRESRVQKLVSRAVELVSIDRTFREQLRHLSDDVGSAFYNVETGEVITIRYGKHKKDEDILRVAVIPVTYSTIEEAIAAMDIIGPSYHPESGIESAKDRAALELSLNLQAFWENTPVSEERRQEREQEVLDFLDKSGLNRAVDLDRKTIVDNLEEGIGPGSLFYPNPSARLTQVAVAETTAEFRVDEVDGKTFVKYDRDLKNLLLAERETARKRLLRVRYLMNSLDKLHSFTPKGHARDFERKTLAVIRQLPELLGRFSVRVAPYRGIGQEILAAFDPDLGGRAEETMELVLGNEVYTDYKGIRRIKSLFRENPVEARGEVVRNVRWAGREITSTLRAGDKLFVAAKRRAREIITERERKTALSV